MRTNVPDDDFVASSLDAERSGAFAPYFAETRPAARRLVRKLLAAGESADSGQRSSTDSLGHWLGSLVGFLVAPHGGMAAAALAPGAGMAAASMAGGLGGAIAAAATSLLGAVVGGEEVNEPTVSAEAEAAKASTSSITLHFRSIEPKEERGHWAASLRIPAPGTAVERIVVRVTTPRSATGVFRICGIAVPIEKGRGEFPLASFRARLSAGGVSFALPGASPTPGAPYLKV